MAGAALRCRAIPDGFIPYHLTTVLRDLVAVAAQWAIFQRPFRWRAVTEAQRQGAAWLGIRATEADKRGRY